jgi:hypothetical protein
MSKLENQNPSEFNKVRPVDELAKDVESWWEKSFIYVGKNEIKAWKAYAIVAFFGGLAAATIFLVSFNLHLKSNAEANASTLMLFPSNIEVRQGDNFDVDLALNTKENNVVVVKAYIDYDVSRFSLNNVDTSESIFALNNPCVYQGKACEIIEKDSNAGRVMITLAKPTTGVKTASGSIAKLTFTALQAHAASEDGIRIRFTMQGSYNDSDVIADDANGTDILTEATTSVITIAGPVCTTIGYTDWSVCQPDGIRTRAVDPATSIPVGCEPINPVVTDDTCEYIPPVCTDYTYSDWGECQPNSTYSRIITASIPDGCVGGVTPETEGSCNYVPPTCTDFTYSDWAICQPDGTQNRTVTSNSPAGCSGGSPVLQQACTPPGDKEIICTDFTYSDWGACQPNGTYSRTVASSSPVGCTGGNPQTEGTCTYNTSTCTDFTYSDWGACQPNGTYSRTVASSSPVGCTGGNPQTEGTCTYNAPICTSFVYSDWGSCYSGLKIRKIISSSPAGCSGGDPVLVRKCDYYDKKTSSGTIKITDLPMYLSKHPGEKIWWNATSKYGISYYTISAVGQAFNTPNNSFNIPLNTPTGYYILKVTAHDKAGYAASVSSLVRITSW